MLAMQCPHTAKTRADSEEKRDKFFVLIATLIIQTMADIVLNHETELWRLSYFLTQEAMVNELVVITHVITHVTVVQNQTSNTLHSFASCNISSELQ